MILSEHLMVKEKRIQPDSRKNFSYLGFIQKDVHDADAVKGLCGVKRPSNGQVKIVRQMRQKSSIDPFAKQMHTIQASSANT